MVPISSPLYGFSIIKCLSPLPSRHCPLIYWEVSLVLVIKLGLSRERNEVEYGSLLPEL